MKKRSGAKVVVSAFTARVYAVVAKISKGRVMTYGEVAERAGNVDAARAVGNIMHHNPDTAKVPCHRVVRSDGAPGGYARGTQKKIALLKSEGVKFTAKGGKIMVKTRH
jgi:O-6-methylguanine DNA methyltransferase